MTFASTLPVINNYPYYAQLGINGITRTAKLAAKSDIVNENDIYIVYSVINNL